MDRLTLSTQTDSQSPGRQSHQMYLKWQVMVGDSLFQRCMSSDNFLSAAAYYFLPETHLEDWEERMTTKVGAGSLLCLGPEYVAILHYVCSFKILQTLSLPQSLIGH
jgi:hypothetical protein